MANQQTHNEFNPFSMADLWDQYKEMVGFESVPIDSLQHVEMKRAFMGGAGQLFLVLKKTLGNTDIATAILILEGMESQIAAFWEQEATEVQNFMNRSAKEN